MHGTTERVKEWRTKGWMMMWNPWLRHFLRIESVSCYCLPTNLGEGVVFSCVCLFWGRSLWPLPMMHWTLLTPPDDMGSHCPGTPLTSKCKIAKLIPFFKIKMLLYYSSNWSDFHLINWIGWNHWCNNLEIFKAWDNHKMFSSVFGYLYKEMHCTQVRDQLCLWKLG